MNDADKKASVQGTVGSGSAAAGSDLQRDIEKARMIQSRLRSVAPGNIKVGGHYEDTRERLARMHIPEAFDDGVEGVGPNRKVRKPATHSCMTDRPEMYKQRIAEGWEPVVVEGEHLSHAGDVFFKRPIEFSRSAADTAAKTSTERLASMREITKDNELVAAYEKQTAGEK